jgi:DNA-binding transcriptional ArsR family regulator
MDRLDLERRLDALASLAAPVRPALYWCVAGREQGLGRDEAAVAVGISRKLAAYHLDKLAEAGLLEVRFERRSGRTGPGAGRPAGKDLPALRPPARGGPAGPELPAPRRAARRRGAGRPLRRRARRPRAGGPRHRRLGDRRPTRAVAGLDLDPTSGRARLSYRRAAELFQARTGWTLHQLRHSALTHAAEDGTNLPLLLARSWHASVRSLERYAPPRTRGGRPPPRRD